MSALRVSIRTFVSAGLFGFLFAPVHAARVGDLTESTYTGQFFRFLTLQDPSLRYALVGVVLLGLSCGLLGSFIVVRKMALMGDALSHAVLPGVAAGFLWNSSKDPVAIFIGATVAGMLGTAAVNAIVRTTRIKEDAALGLVLASFFGAGLCLQSMIQQLPTGNKSGLDKFMFGQAAAIGRDDVVLMAVVTTAAVALVTSLYKELLVTSFDEGFARSAGVPTRWIHHALMLLLAMTIVISLQAVGVVLVSAMLITPAAAAYLLTDRLHRMLALAALFGVAAGVAGAFVSFVGKNLPTGPLMVLAASGIFVSAFFFAPRHGVLARWWRRRETAGRTRRENTLKAVYHLWEQHQGMREATAFADLAAKRRVSRAAARNEANELVRHGLATLAGETVSFTPAGHRRAAEIVRNHRLWELYLTQRVNIAPDHVHDDAEKIEHVLGDELVRQLERRLNHASVDPHGRAIPSVGTIHAGAGLCDEAKGRK